MRPTSWEPIYPCLSQSDQRIAISLHDITQPETGRIVWNLQYLWNEMLGSSTEKCRSSEVHKSPLLSSAISIRNIWMYIHLVETSRSQDFSSRSRGLWWWVQSRGRDEFSSLTRTRTDRRVLWFYTWGTRSGVKRLASSCWRDQLGLW